MKQKHLIVRSRNKSRALLKEIEVPITTIYRMGSTTPTKEITRHKKYIEINSVESCALSSNKIKSKARFIHAHIPTAEYFTVKKSINSDISLYSKCDHYLTVWKHGIIAKRRNSSRGNGIELIASMDDCMDFLNKYKNDIPNWIFERYYTYTREYRLHVTHNGCFLAGRKMLRNDAEVRWHRHANNSTYIKEDNPLFDTPSNWDDIVISCQYALKSLGLDIAAFDVKVQNNKVKIPKYIILESNSAPGLGELGIEKYKEELNTLINEKYQF